MGMSSSELIELSFAESIVTIKGVGKLESFVDDANPIEFQDCDVANIEYSLNGKMIRSVKPHGIVMSVTLYPGSPDDKKLFELWKQSHANDGDYGSKVNEDIEATIAVSGGRVGQISRSSGTMISGPGGVGVNGKGKMNGRTYTFIFNCIR